MPVTLSDYSPKSLPLFKAPADPQAAAKWVCPVEGLEDVWVRVIPPSWRDDKERTGYVNTLTEIPGSSILDRYEMEIVLTYGGTNLSVKTMKRDPETGRPLFTDDTMTTVEYETVEFDPEGKLDRKTLFERLSKLPDWLVIAWHDRMLEAVPQWGPSFRR